VFDLTIWQSISNQGGGMYIWGSRQIKGKHYLNENQIIIVINNNNNNNNNNSSS